MLFATRLFRPGVHPTSLPLQVNMPEDRDWCPGGGWWDVCGVPRDDVYAVVRQVAELYAMPRATYVDVRAAAAAAGAIALSPVPHGAAPADSGGPGAGSPDGGSVQRQAASAEEGLQDGSAPSGLRANGVADGGDAPSGAGREAGRAGDTGDTGISHSEVRVTPFSQMLCLPSTCLPAVGQQFKYASRKQLVGSRMLRLSAAMISRCPCVTVSCSAAC